MRISDWAIRNIRPVVFLTALLCVAGAFLYSTFPVSILPDVTFPRVVIVAEAGSRPTKVIEASVTKPIEDVLATIPNVKRIRSKTRPGSTEVSVDFLDGTDVIQAEQFVNAKINQIRSQLPSDTQTEIERMNPTVFPVLGLTLHSKSLTQTELWNLATYTLRPRLARVEGVARVVVQGGRPPEIAVIVSPERLTETGFSNTDIVNAIQSSNSIRSVGRLNREFKRYEIVLNGEKTSAEDLKQIVVGRKGTTPIHLSQVADVVASTEERNTVVSANGSESVLINIVRQPSANSVSMVSAVEQELSSLRRTLPAGTEIGLYYDQSVLIKEAVASVRDAVLLGGVLSVIVLLLFLRDLRATLVTATIIPVTLLITFLLMRLSGLTLNLMTLGALAVGIGLIIDDAIVVVEAVFRYLSPSRTVKEAVQLASSQIAAPMLSSTLTTVVVFVPLAFLQGVAGAFFLALALTLTMALLVSLVLALCLSPSLCSAFLKYRQGVDEEGRVFHLVSRGYERTLALLLKHRWVTLPAILGIVVGIVGLGTALPTGFMPSIDEGAFVLDYLTPPGTSLEESDRLLQKVDGVLMSTPEISTFSRRTGTELGLAITESNRGDYAVMLNTKRKRKIDDVIGDVRTQIQSQIGGLDVDFVQVLQDLIGDLAGTPNPIEVKFFGENKAETEKVATAFAERLGKIKGLLDVKSGIVESSPLIEFVPDETSVGRRGLTNDQVASQLEAALSGTIASQMIVGDRQVPVRVRFSKGYRTDLTQIEALPIMTSAGTVPLRDLGQVRLLGGSTQSSREDQRRLLAVTGRLGDMDLGTAVTKVKAELKSFPLPPGVVAVVAGQYQSQQESFRNLTLVLGASVLLVFTVMVFQFGRFEAPLIILILMPLGVFGAVLALYVTNTALNVSSFMGVIMLAGIVVKNGILLLDQAQKSYLSGRSLQESIQDAGHTRLRPILMTTLTAILGLIPLALGIGAGAEMQKPLAIAVIGGLIFSTVVTLLLGPTLYVSIMTFFERQRKLS